ncbi:hypothetical protein D6C81_10497 [Aureobasidium pullulans]|nr:hypothetical protein D6C81_10497 [Aureobasidium pullulans]
MFQPRQIFYNHNGKKLSFLDLPTEVRYLIYRCVFAPSNENTVIKMSTDAFHLSRFIKNRPIRPVASDPACNSLSILATCQTIRTEARQLFWALTSFSFSTTTELNIFLKQNTILAGLPRRTNLENIQHVIPVNDDINNHDHVYRDRVLTKLVNGSSIVSLAIQHNDRWPCWCERCLDVQEVFDVEWEEQLEERTAEEERVEELNDKHAATWEQDQIDLELEFAGWEELVVVLSVDFISSAGQRGDPKTGTQLNAGEIWHVEMMAMASKAHSKQRMADTTVGDWMTTFKDDKRAAKHNEPPNENSLLPSFLVY